MIGQQFENWTVIGNEEKNKDGCKVFLCRCVCGVERMVRKGGLISGGSKSCGCSRYHWMYGSREHRTWYGMKNRCSNEKSDRYPFYGGRGIKVCSRWLDFKNFYADMGDRPAMMTIDRIDNNGDYCPENCRWATHIEQCNNRRSNVWIEHDGKRMTLTQWSVKLGINLSTLASRRNYGWSDAEVLTGRSEIDAALEKLK